MISPADCAERAWAALEAGDAVAAWQAMKPLEPQLERDQASAAAWLDLLRATPNRPTLEAEVDRILRKWPHDGALVTRACDALIKAAELVPPDVPPPARGPAQRAAKAAEEGLNGISDPDLAAYLQMARGNALRLIGQYEQAEACMRAAMAHAERGGFWLNLGLLYKAQRNWKEAATAISHARRLLGEQKPVLWNVAICAIALGDGKTAVEALRALGHDAQLSASGMPYVDNLPPLQIRAATVGSGYGTGSSLPDHSVGFELLWVTPISPCHGVVSSASYREASVDYGDVVLWDAVPVGIAEHDGKPIPRMPLLAILNKGREQRFRFVALQQAAEQVAALGADMPEDSKLFVHHERIEMLCARCASGEHMQKHTHEPPAEHRLVYGKIIVPEGRDLHAFNHALHERLRQHSGVRLVVPGLFEAIGDTVAAGKAHQLWRALERVGLAGGGGQKRDA